MCSKGINCVAVMICCVGILFVPQCGNGYAWDGHERSHYPGHHPRAIMELPRAHQTVLVCGLPYYYDSGFFYRRGSSGYVLVTAPVGAVVPILPVSSQTVMINGRMYYTYDNVYYVEQPTGYVVVTQPTVTTITVPAATQATDSYVVNVPNTNGSYMPVVIKKDKEGFVGPHGEFYEEQPTIDQLKAMYAQ